MRLMTGRGRGSVVSCSRCRGYSRGGYVRIGVIKGRREGIQVNRYREEKNSPGGRDRGREGDNGNRSLGAQEKRGYGNDKDLWSEYLCRLRFERNRKVAQPDPWEDD